MKVLSGGFQHEVEAPVELRQRADFTAILEERVASAGEVGELVAFARDLDQQGVTLGKPEADVSYGHKAGGPGPGDSIRDFNAEEALGSALDDMRRWLRSQLSDDSVVRLGEPRYGYLDVPVILIGAPNVEGAEVKWTETQSKKRSDGLKITVGVLGFGESITTESQESFSESASAGKTKQVLWKVPVMISPWGHKTMANEVQPFITVDRIEWDKYPQRWVTRDDMTVSSLGPGLTPGPIEDRSNASDAKNGSASEAAERTSTFSIGLKAEVSGVEITKEISLEVSGSSKYNVEWVLPGGHAFRRYEPARGLGLIWQLIDAP